MRTVFFDFLRFQREERGSKKAKTNPPRHVFSALGNLLLDEDFQFPELVYAADAHSALALLHEKPRRVLRVFTGQEDCILYTCGSASYCGIPLPPPLCECTSWMNILLHTAGWSFTVVGAAYWDGVEASIMVASPAFEHSVGFVNTLATALLPGARAIGMSFCTKPPIDPYDYAILGEAAAHFYGEKGDVVSLPHGIVEHLSDAIHDESLGNPNCALQFFNVAISGEQLLCLKGVREVILSGCVQEEHRERALPDYPFRRPFTTPALQDPFVALARTIGGLSMTEAAPAIPQAAASSNTGQGVPFGRSHHGPAPSVETGAGSQPSTNVFHPFSRIHQGQAASVGSIGTQLIGLTLSDSEVDTDNQQQLAETEEAVELQSAIMASLIPTQPSNDVLRKGDALEQLQLQKTMKASQHQNVEKTYSSSERKPAPRATTSGHSTSTASVQDAASAKQGPGLPFGSKDQDLAASLDTGGLSTSAPGSQHSNDHLVDALGQLHLQNASGTSSSERKPAPTALGAVSQPSKHALVQLDEGGLDSAAALVSAVPDRVGRGVSTGSVSSQAGFQEDPPDSSEHPSLGDDDDDAAVALLDKNETFVATESGASGGSLVLIPAGGGSTASTQQQQPVSGTGMSMRGMAGIPPGGSSVGSNSFASTEARGQSILGSRGSLGGGHAFEGAAPGLSGATSYVQPTSIGTQLIGLTLSDSEVDTDNQQQPAEITPTHFQRPNNVWECGFCGQLTGEEKGLKQHWTSLSNTACVEGRARHTNLVRAADPADLELRSELEKRLSAAIEEKLVNKLRSKPDKREELMRDIPAVREFVENHPEAGAAVAD